jgi:hypothetical protein
VLLVRLTLSQRPALIAPRKLTCNTHAHSGLSRTTQIKNTYQVLRPIFSLVSM